MDDKVENEKFKVTDKEYTLDGFVQQIGDSIAARVTERKQDILCIITGQEGSGKTNASVALGYYIAWKANREFTVDNVFFDLDDMIKYAGENKEKIIVWDEAALGGLAADWTNTSQRKLKAMLMICRKKRHVFIFNVPRFYRLSGGIIERAYCMFYIYENDKEKPGCFMFFGQTGLEALYNNWRTKKYASYWKFKKLYGMFAWVLPQLIDEDAYEAKKDAAILRLAQTDEPKKDKVDKLQEERKKMLFYLINRGLSNTEIAKIFSISLRTVGEWKKKSNLL